MVDALNTSVAKGGYVAPEERNYLASMRNEIDKTLGAGASKGPLTNDQLLELTRNPVIAKDMKRFVNEIVLGDAGIQVKVNPNEIFSFDKAMCAVARRLADQGGAKELADLSSALGVPENAVHDNMRNAFDQAAAEKLVRAEVTAGVTPNRLRSNGAMLYEKLWGQTHTGWDQNDFASKLRPGDQQAMQKAVDQAIEKLTQGL